VLPLSRKRIIGETKETKTNGVAALTAKGAKSSGRIPPCASVPPFLRVKLFFVSFVIFVAQT